MSGEPLYSPLAEVIRDGVVESRHSGVVSVVRGGVEVAHCGDSSATMFARSSLKPFQLLAMLDAGLSSESWSAADLAVMASSHSGQPEHLAQVRLAVLPGDQHENLAETRPAVGQQVAPASSTPPSASDETVTLSPFLVSTEKDTGYIAADTLNAGRLRTNLLMTPGTMEVFTRDLLDDLGVFNIDEASAWLTSSHPLETNGINGNSMNPASLGQHDSGSNVSLRGMATQPSTRNYFLSATTPMEYNVQRVEAGRGPNAILYGEGGPGGSGARPGPRGREARRRPRRRGRDGSCIPASRCPDWGRSAVRCRCVPRPHGRPPASR